MESTTRNTLVFVALVLVLLVLVGLFSKPAACIETTHDIAAHAYLTHHEEAYETIIGHIRDYIPVGYGIVIRMQPLDDFFTSDFLFCDLDNVHDMMQGLDNPVVLTVDPVAHRMIEGVCCKTILNATDAHYGR